MARGGRPRWGERGSVLFLAVLGVGIALVAGSSVLLSATASSAVSRVRHEHVQARQVGESGMALALRYLREADDWSGALASGAWTSGLSLMGGSVTVEMEPPAGLVQAGVNDASFEQASGSLAQPLLNPPMSGQIGGWDASRWAVLPLGPTVPSMSIVSDATSPDGAQKAIIGFGLSVTGGGTFSQTLAQGCAADALHELRVSVKVTGLPPVLGSYGFRVYAGGVLLATSEEALVLVGDESLSDVLAQAASLQVAASLASTLETFVLSDGWREYALRFASGDAPAGGALRIELFADSIGALTTVSFDHVRLRVTPTEPVVLRSTARVGGASHVSEAAVSSGLDGGVRVVEWREP